MKKNLPIGISSFEKIRSEPYYYVDKTPFVAKLVSEGKYYFLSRPRRFGKSLFVDTLKQAFLGRKELFQGLYLEKNWDWSVRYPVIHIDFGGRTLKGEEHLITYILEQLEKNQETLGVSCSEKTLYDSCFEELILKSYEKYKQKVVVLVDEYDKPILDCIEDREAIKRIRDILVKFYIVLKPLDRYLKFVLLTGVLKFYMSSIFSGLNFLNDITLSRKYSTICGFTQEELEEVFREELQDKDLELIKCWYNGYSWLGEPVYNPFDVLLYLKERQFHPYWFETGTPSFLIKLLVEKKFYIPQLSELMASERLLGSFDVDFIEPENLLFQTGYLTIKGVEEIPSGYLYYLSYPNKEVRVSLNNYIVDYLTRKGPESARLTLKLTRALREGKVSAFGEVLKALFSGIPYEWYRSNEIAGYEGYYASVVYSFLEGAGFEVIPEDYTSLGRIDLTIIFEERCFIVEFKVVEMEGESPKAIEKLKEKGYHQKYPGRFKEIYLIGLDFSKEKKTLSNFDWIKL